MRMLTMAILLASAAAYPAQAQIGDRGGDRANSGSRAGQMRVGEDRGARNEARGPRNEAARESRDERRAQAPEIRQQADRGRWEQRGQAPAAPVVQARPRPDPGGNRNWQRPGNDTMTTNTPNTVDRRRWDGNRAEGRQWDGNRNDGRQRDANRNEGRQWNGDRNDGRQRDANRNEGRHWNGNRDNDRDGNVGVWHRGDNGNWQRRENWNRDNRNWNNHSQYRDWNRTWRNDHRYDWRHYRNEYRDRYRAPRYYNPYGYNYGYRRFGIGIYLDSLYFGNTYWLSDPWEYRLPPAPYGCRWVRYYDDVLLVDIRSGYVVDVIHDFFW